jgi:hypothetical protein
MLTRAEIDEFIKKIILMYNNCRLDSLTNIKLCVKFVM